MVSGRKHAIWLLPIAALAFCPVRSVARAETYRTFINDFRASHPTLEPRGTVRVALGDSERLREPYVAAMLQWECSDPALRVEFESASSSR